MPSSNGVYSLPPGYLAVTGATIQASQHNPPLEDIAAALTARLSRDGTAAMTGPLQAVPGAVGLPGVVFSTDTTTGFYKTTAGVGVSVAGTKVAEITAAGIASGVWSPGMLIPWTLSAAPSALWVLPNGQTLSRTTYPTLWAQAQLEIAAGNTFYNNGDGSTTFGIGDTRGRVLAGFDVGNVSGRLTSPVNAAVIGAAGGAQSVALTVAQLPTGITSSGTNTITVSATNNGRVLWGAVAGNGFSGTAAGGGSFNVPGVPLGSDWQPVSSISGSNSVSVTSNNTSGAAHSNVQPTIVTNYLLFAGN